MIVVVATLEAALATDLAYMSNKTDLAYQTKPDKKPHTNSFKNSYIILLYPISHNTRFMSKKLNKNFIV